MASLATSGHDIMRGVATLAAVESFFPERVVTVEERAGQLGLTPAQTHMMRRIHGLDRMNYDPDLDMLDLIMPPAVKVLAQADPGQVRYLIHCQTMHGTASAAAETAKEIKAALGLKRATAFTLTQQNCAIPLSAIDIAGTLLRADGDPEALALIVTGDKPVDRNAQVVMNTCVVGDGAASCLVSLDGPGAAIRSFATVARGEYSDGLRSTPEQLRASAAERVSLIRQVMEEAAARAGVTIDDLQVIIPTNPNVTFWAEAVETMGLQGRFFLDNVPRHSHCLAADVFINYVTLRDEGRLEPGRPAMFVAIGIGMTYSAMVFTPPSSTGAS
jgi:3-oxoacyl-[acyl-carrier-protein] synthase-3